MNPVVDCALQFSPVHLHGVTLQTGGFHSMPHINMKVPCHDLRA